jgi:hypothetical protein
MEITEELLYFIWKFRYYDFQHLVTVDGEKLEIVHPGFRNDNAGPDFSQAKIKIDDTLWAGSVEIHVMASEWQSHKHQLDPAYNNVTLHVVWKKDAMTLNEAGVEIPCLELYDRVDSSMIRQYDFLMKNEKWVPCADQIHTTPDLVKKNWLQRLMAERLASKSASILVILKHQKEDWQSVAYQKLARALGTQVNGEAMEMLARICPLSIIGKHKDQLLQIEALLFGQSGLLPTAHSEQEYLNKLRLEYDFLKNKYTLIPMQRVQWKFLRMRPTNFPTIRIAQLARLLFQSQHLFSKLIAAEEVKEIIHLLDVTVSHYWKDHFTFDTEASSPKEKRLGKLSIHTIVINTVCPLLFAYGLSTDDEKYKEKALRFLSELPAEVNAITRSWAALGVQADSAMDSQALIQLKNNFCNEKKCLYCSIGHQLLKQTK